MREWISVADRLPDLDEPVWLFGDRGIWIGGRTIVEGGDEYAGAQWGWCNAYSTLWQKADGRFDAELEYDDDYHVTHWQPLFTPPVGGQEVEYVRADLVRDAMMKAEAALADIGDADREPGDDIAWCERRAAQALPAIRAALAMTANAGNQRGA